MFSQCKADDPTQTSVYQRLLITKDPNEWLDIKKVDYAIAINICRIPKTATRQYLDKRRDIKKVYDTIVVDICQNKGGRHSD